MILTVGVAAAGIDEFERLRRDVRMARQQSVTWFFGALAALVRPVC